MFKKLLIIVTCSLSLAACKKDPEDVSLRGAYSSGEFPKNINDLLGVLGAGYAQWRVEHLAGFNLMTKMQACSDHSADLAYGGDLSWTELAANELSVSNSYANGLWAQLYVGVKTMNAFLDRADFFEKKYMVASEQQMVNYMRGEAYFLRAWYYFNLESFFGEAYVGANGANDDKWGVPIYTSIPTDVQGTQQPRKKAREVWNFIIEDLKKSADLLKGAQWTGVMRGRVNEWSAKGLLGKVYVFTQDWPNAKTTLLDVIQNSGKTLMPFAKYREAFNDKPENEFNEESLFEINIDRTPANYGIFADFPPNKNLTSSQGLLWAPSCVGDNGIEGGPNNNLGYCNEFVHDKNLRRFGFDLPIYNLVTNPAFDNTKAPSLTNQQLILDPAYRQQSVDLRTNKTVDPRLYVCALQPWVDSVKNNDIPRPVGKCVGIGGGIQQYFHGWSFKKFTTMDNNLWAKSNAADGANYYLLRLADIYLLYAEACANASDPGTALEYINKVHRRAYGVANFNAPSAYDYASLTSATKANDPNLANNPLRFERYTELFAEGHWWFDVCRWRIGKAEATYFGIYLPTGAAIPWSDDRSYAFPIPSDEINTNGNIGSQNGGY